MSVIRLLHLADTHIGVETYGRLDSATGLSTRLADFLAALDRAVDYAVQQRVDLVVFAGDAYKTRDPSPTHQREFARRVRRLCQAGIPCFLLVGNHDLPNAQSRAHATEIFDTLAVEGVTVARTIATTRINTPSGTVQVVSLPWVTRSALLTKDEHKNRSIDQLNSLLLEKLGDLLRAELAALDPGLPAVLVGHCTVQGSVYGSERSVMLGQDVVFPPSLLAHPLLDYIALGHIHKYQVLPGQPPIVYSGSLERIDFGEENEEKGFVDVELRPEGRGARFRFIPVAARRFVTVDVCVDQGDPTEQTLEAISRHDVTGAVVRVLVHGGTNVRLNEGAVRQALKDAYYVAAVAQQMEQRARRRLGPSGAEGLSPREALLAYLQSRDLPAEHRQLLLAYADILMAGESEAETDR